LAQAGFISQHAIGQFADNLKAEGELFLFGTPSDKLNNVFEKMV
jgi:hypothetical protein